MLIRGGFIRKEVSGVYNFLPLGLKVLTKISNIIREEMNDSGAQELLLVSLQRKESWEKTKRWDSFDALFKVKSRYDFEYALGPTHEEVLVPLVKNFVNSYRDLPLKLYQIQNKFRDEPRAKAGLLRGREFLMKDLYSFHENEEDLMKYYEVMKKVYKKTFSRLGLLVIETVASGGTFSKFSHEFQVVCENGEDEIIYCPASVKTSAGKPGFHFSENSEITKVKEGKECDLGHGPLKRVKTIEAGNIFPLKDKFSKAFGLTFKDKNGAEKYVVMCCYGIGISRVMGAIAEVHNDKKGIVWPSSVSPYAAHLITISNQQSTINNGDKIYQKLIEAGVDVLYDEREDVSVGQKFADADLIGIPVRLVVSKRVGKEKVEWKERDQKETREVSFEKVVELLS